MRVTVAGGVARLQEDLAGPGQPGVMSRAEAIAGSTATLADVVRHAITAGLPIPDVAAAASTTPARVLGLAGRTGALSPGLAADLVVCDGDFRPRAVMRRGQWLAGPAGY
jgi:N-acetylglucosamine-6-phosphate deacetylase